MKVKLKSRGFYSGMESVKFPVEIFAKKAMNGVGVYVLGADINSLKGCRKNCFDPCDAYFFADDEIEVIEE